MAYREPGLDPVSPSASAIAVSRSGYPSAKSPRGARPIGESTPCVLRRSYAGSLIHVLSRVLDGYDYVIRHGSSELDVVILEKRGSETLEKRGMGTLEKRDGENAVVPELHPVSQHRERER